MKQEVLITAFYNQGTISAKADDPVLSIEREIQTENETVLEYKARITNRSEEPVVLEHVRLFEADSLQDTGIGEGPYTVFRSGRHKNDMPGVFVTGCRDERMEDVSSVMAETGGEVSVSEAACVISDHLTLLGGENGRVLAVEFLTGRDQLFETVIRLDGDGNFAGITADVMFNIILKPGQSVQTETIRIACVNDAAEEVQQFAERKAQLYGSRNQRHPAVFCTWYYYGLTVSLEDVFTCLNIIHDRKLPYDVFQVDEGWEVTLGEYRPNERFPISMKELASIIREKGYTPGIWSSPFVAHETASVWKDHPEWILKDQAGKPILFPMNDTVYYVFDITVPETLDYFRDLYRMFTDDWGYVYHKLDFTRAAVIYEDADFHDKTITMAQAYYRAVKAIREGMGEDSFFLMCGGLYDPIIGLVDGQRTGSDVLSMWSSNINKGGKTAPYTIKQSILRNYMNAWWANDPDALMIRKNEVIERDSRLTYGLLNDEEVKTVLVNQFAGGGIMCQTEPMDKVSDDRLMEIRHLLPMVRMQVRPLSILSEERFPSAVDVYLPETDTHCICLINWSDTDGIDAKLDLSALGLPEGTYMVSGFYSGRYETDVKEDTCLALGEIMPHGAEVMVVRKQTDQPAVIASDMHYSLGAELETLKLENGNLILRRKPILSVPAWYTVFLPGSWTYKDEKTAEITLGPDETEIILPLEQNAEEGGE